MKLLSHLFEKNQEWARRSLAEDPTFFERNLGQQTPPYCWIGCSDSRIPVNTIVDLPPGEVFVHRNVANLIEHQDANSLSAIRYGISLGVEHLLIVGHYGCAGVRAALSGDPLPDPLGEWLEPLRQTYLQNIDHFRSIADDQAQWDLLCELNVRQQVKVACQLPMVQECWASGHRLAIHGWIYNVRNGRLKDLGVTIDQSTNNGTGGHGIIAGVA